MSDNIRRLIILSILFIFITGALYSNKLVGINSTRFNAYDYEKEYYLSYNFSYEGFINPKIIDITLLDENYKPIPYDNNAFSYEFYIDENKHTGALSEDSDLIKNIKAEHKMAKGYKIRDKECQVVLKIVFHNKIDADFTPYIRINYNILWVKRNLKKKIGIVD